MFNKVLVPVDVTMKKDTEKLLNTVKILTAGWTFEIHVATVVPMVSMPIVGSYFDKDFETESSAAAAKELASAVSGANIDAKKHVLAGTVYDAVIHLASKLDVDLIVIGAHQPELRHYLLGSNASRVVRHSKSSVLVLR